jgi:hypothetical protein
VAQEASSRSLLPQSPKDLVFILTQIQDRENQDARRLRMIEDPIWESVHHLTPNFFQIDGRDPWEYSQTRKIRVNRFHEFAAQSLPVILKQIKRFLQIGVGSR